MLKNLFKDSMVYGLACGIQKLVPFLIIPVITHNLGSNALKVYDISFVYAYLFSWLIILGQDSAVSIYYFSDKEAGNKKEVLRHGLIIQTCFLFLIALVFFPLRNFAAGALFGMDAEIRRYWLKALLIIPGHILLNYVLNILIWQRKKTRYLILCIIQLCLSVGGVFVSVVWMHGGTEQLFMVLIASTTITACTGFGMLAKTLSPVKSIPDLSLIKTLVWIGIPFALTSFFHQMLPSVDRYFLLTNHYDAELPQYILAVKIGGFISVLIAAFALAFTPYSMSKLNEPGGATEISLLFRFVSAAAFLMVPLLLLFKDLMIRFFADASYQATVKLLPVFFFGWVFELFLYFSMLGVYKSKKSYIVLILFSGGVLLVAILNAILIPRFGLYGAAASFCIAKAGVFFSSLIWLGKYFKLTVDIFSFTVFLLVTGLCSYLVYQLQTYQYLVLLAIVVATSFLYLQKLFQKHRHVFVL